MGKKGGDYAQRCLSYREYMGDVPLAIRSLCILTVMSGATLREEADHPSHLRELLGVECSSPMGFYRSEPGGCARCTSAQREAAVMLLRVRE